MEKNQEFNNKMAYIRIINFLNKNNNPYAIQLANKYLAKLPTKRDFISFNVLLKCMLNACIKCLNS